MRCHWATAPSFEPVIASVTRGSDDELEEIGGKKDRLVGKLQQKHGYTSDEAHRRAYEWAKQ
jgi:ElaB/YqjD/DUF883 family membrane-anchored ribosome-binding protein